MIYKAVDTSEVEGKIIIDTLLQYEGLLTSIIQWGFWEDTNRPDIATELTSDERVNIVRLGKVALNRLIKAAYTEEGRKRLVTIGTTPIISKEYDPECKISFVVGLIHRTKIEGWTMDTSKSLRLLLCNTGCSCADKDVITELIDLGINTSDNRSDDRWIVHVTICLHFMVLKKYNNDIFWYPNDTHVAFALRGGLIELCLTFIERFGLNESFDEEKDNLRSLFYYIEGILSNIYWIGLHKKTAKAIRSKRGSIEKQLVRLEQNTNITNNPKCKELLDMVRSMLDTNGSYCCRCNKSLSRTEVKECNGCNLMAYCSKSCQKEDWLNGHSVTCCKSFTNETADGQFQGTYHPVIPLANNEKAAAKLKEMETNMNMIQLKLFLDNAESILTQTEGLDPPLYDCVVVFNLCQCPPTVSVQDYRENFLTPLAVKSFEQSRSKENITCDFYSYIFNGELDKDGDTPNLVMQRFFPLAWLTNKKKSKENT